MIKPGYEYSFTSPSNAVVNVNMASRTSAPDAETRFASLFETKNKSRIWFLNEINIIVVDKLVSIMIFRLPVGQRY